MRSDAFYAGGSVADVETVVGDTTATCLRETANFVSLLSVVGFFLLLFVLYYGVCIRRYYLSVCPPVLF